MFTDQLDAAIDDAPMSANHLADLSRRIWLAWSAGTLTDDQAQAAAIRLAARKAAERSQNGDNRQGGSPQNAPTAFLRARSALPKRRNQQSPDKQRSIERRRRLAASGGLPPSIAQAFTVSEQAALRVVTNAARRNGVCGLCIDAIAALAGTCRTVVKTALRKSASLGLLLVRERRRAGQRSLTNIVSVISHAVRSWLRMPDKGTQSTALKTWIRGGRKNDCYALDRVL